MKKSVRYEHKVVNEWEFNDSGKDGQAKMLQMLDQLSAGRWEVVSAIGHTGMHGGGDFRILLRREIET